ncbi:TetR/AcrR family transcriptional regulator [Sulfurospirillum sp. 1612]|uniref:TetR/AcrR family transcriptional regulator n=1 Tax=Sulfurospirillum sp. 1612 TaxID=3094835 RepID=UPI002F93CFF7
MARPAEYDLNTVLENAMELFWQKGYDKVSMADLVSFTGLNRRTMYALFGDKEGLFKEALEHYYAKRALCNIQLLQSHPGKKGIVKFLEKFAFDRGFKGCLFTNCMNKGDFMRAEAFHIPKDFFTKLQQQIEENLKEAKAHKEFSGDPKSMALTIITLVHGLNIHGKYNHSKEDGDSIIKNIAAMIT